MACQGAGGAAVIPALAGPGLAKLALRWLVNGLPVLILFAAALWLRGHYIGVGEARADARHAATAAAVAAAQDAEVTRVRNAEAAHAADLAGRDRDHLEEMNRAKHVLDAAVADLDNGRLRLRRASADRCADGHLPTPAATAGVGDGAKANGLSRSNAEFLLRIGNDADDTARQLAACQSVVASYYAACGAEPSPPTPAP